MRFASIRQILEQLNVEFAIIDEKVIKSTKNALKNHFSQNKTLKIDGFEFTEPEIDFILGSLNDKTLVFHDWIHQDFALHQYLISLGEIRKKPNAQQHENHQLKKAYKDYLSWFLKPILVKLLHENTTISSLQELSEHIVFSDYLAEIDRIEVQRTVSDFIRKTFNDNKNVDFIENVYSSAFIGVLNGLDKHFYSDFVAFIDKTKRFVKNEPLEDVQKAKIRKALLRLQLTEKHQTEVVRFANSAYFKMQSSSRKKGLNKLFQPYIIYVLGGFFIVLIAYFILNQPDSKEKTEIVTGAEELTDEELLEIDSLIKSGK